MDRHRFSGLRPDPARVVARFSCPARACTVPIRGQQVVGRVMTPAEDEVEPLAARLRRDSGSPPKNYEASCGGMRDRLAHLEEARELTCGAATMLLGATFTRGVRERPRPCAPTRCSAPDRAPARGQGSGGAQVRGSVRGHLIDRLLIGRVGPGEQCVL